MLSYPDGDGFNGQNNGQDVSKTSARAVSDRVAPARLSWQWSRFSELGPDDLYAVVRLREAVFIVEQNRDAQMLSLLKLDLEAALVPRLRSIAHIHGLPLDARSVTDELMTMEGK